MSTQTDTVRFYISDAAQYVSAGASGDGFTTEFAFPYAPISGLKVYLNKVPVNSGFTPNLDLGTVVFDTPVAEDVAVDFSAQATLLTDAQIQLALNQFPNSDSQDQIKLAAADCLDIIASSQALIQKKLKLLDQETDGPALAKALREHAKELRRSVRDGDESSIDFAEQINNVWGYREKIIKDLMRQEE